MINRRKRPRASSKQTLPLSRNDQADKKKQNTARRQLQWFVILAVVTLLVLYSSRRRDDQYDDKSQSPQTNSENNNNLREQDPVAQQGQSPLLDLLERTGYAVDDHDDEELQNKLGQLPTQQEIDDKYGNKAILIGLDTCQAFQSQPQPEEHYISVAGTFNTGTNLMAQLLWENCYMPERTNVYGMGSRGVRWQVPYGKHTPVDNETHRQWHRAPNERDIATNNVLPIVTIRDPYFWMDSMCRHPYEMEWTEDERQCPKLVPTADDPSMFQEMKSFPVRIKYDGTSRMHLSMLHHLNDFYGAYLNASWPRVIVRYEDLIFRPREVTEAACECAGGKMMATLERLRHPESEPFHYVKESAKDNSAVHGKHKTGLLEAMLQYTRTPSHHNMTSADLEFAKRIMDPHLLQLFHYKTVSAQ